MTPSDKTQPTPASPESTEAPVKMAMRTPWQLAWRQLRKHRFALFGGIVLIILYLLMAFAEPLSPYSLDYADRLKFYHPPTIPHLVDATGHWTVRPFVYNTTLVDPGLRTYQEDRTKQYPIRFVVVGEPYRLFGLIPGRIHLFGVDEPAGIFLMGTDAFGRDLFTRILYGSRVSLIVGILSAAVTLPIGMLYGGIAGFYGGRVDNIMMRIAEVIILFPSGYLLITLSAVLPTDVGCTTRFYLIVLILGFIGWAGFSRLIRGYVLALKEQEYVLAARVIGLNDLRIILRHILPNTSSLVIVVASLGIPGAILGESGLSFLGLGVREPCSSWGNLLSAGANLVNLSRSPWLLIPGLFIIAAVVAYNFLGDGLRDAFDPRLRTG